MTSNSTNQQAIAKNIIALLGTYLFMVCCFVSRFTVCSQAQHAASAPSLASCLREKTTKPSLDDWNIHYRSLMQPATSSVPVAAPQPKTTATTLTTPHHTRQVRYYGAIGHYFPLFDYLRALKSQQQKDKDHVIWLFGSGDRAEDQSDLEYHLEIPQNDAADQSNRPYNLKITRISSSQFQSHCRSSQCRSMLELIAQTHAPIENDTMRQQAGALFLKVIAQKKCATEELFDYDMNLALEHYTQRTKEIAELEALVPSFGLGIQFSQKKASSSSSSSSSSSAASSTTSSAAATNASASASLASTTPTAPLVSNAPARPCRLWAFLTGLLFWKSA